MHGRRPTFKMHDALTAIRSSRLLMILTVATAGLLFGPEGLGAQVAPRTSSLPATPLTSLANPNSLPAPIAGTSWGSRTLQRHKARVSYANGLLDVRADNSSLNQILRDISHETGMTIVGGVTDQRIFGNYGPAGPATVLKTLLDGTGTNMLLKETATEGPAELVLTPQTGGSSPPGPNAASYDATESEPGFTLPGEAPPAAIVPSRAAALPRGALVGPVAGAITAVPGSAASNSTTPSASLPPSMPQPLNNVNGSPSNVSPTASTMPVAHSISLDSLPTPAAAPPEPTGIVDAPNPPPAGSTTAGFTSLTPPDANPNNPPATTSEGATTPSSNGAKTPQQIYEELKQLQQQKQSAQPRRRPPPSTDAGATGTVPR